MKGFGFVTFAHSRDADVVLRRLNGTVIDGRKIEVCCLLFPLSLCLSVSQSLSLYPCYYCHKPGSANDVQEILVVTYTSSLLYGYVVCINECPTFHIPGMRKQRPDCLKTRQHRHTMQRNVGLCFLIAVADARARYKPHGARQRWTALLIL